MQLVVKTFKNLNLDELYAVLRLRSEVFVVEQNCVYQDIDNKDAAALHVLGWYNGELVGYTRCFAPGYYFEEAAIGRVIIKEAYRDKGWGHQLMDASINAVKEHYNQLAIKISAQQHLAEFYKSHGFTVVGPGYLEDGIPHYAMLKTTD